MDSPAGLFLVTGLVFVVAGIWIVVRRHGRSILDPGIAFALYYGLFFFLGGSAIVQGEMYMYDATYSSQSITEAYVGFLLFGVLVLSSYEIFGGRLAFERHFLNLYAYETWTTLSNRQLILIAALMLLPGMASLAYLMSIIGQHGYVGFLANRIVLTSGKGYYLLAINWFFSYLILFWVNTIARSIKEGRSINKWGSLGLAMVVSMTGFLQGSRSKGLISFAFMIGLWWILKHTRKARLHSIAMLVVCVGLIVVVGVMLKNVRGNIVSGTKVEENPLELRVFIRGFNAFHAVENTIWLTENLHARDRLLGSSFLAIATGLVPRAVWEQKLLGGGPALVNLMSPGSYDLVSGTSLSSLSPGIVAEGYMNYGFPGYLLTGIVFGGLLAAIARASAWVRSPVSYIIWFYTMYATIGMLTGEVFGSVAGAFGVLIPIVLSHYTLKGANSFRRVIQERSAI